MKCAYCKDPMEVESTETVKGIVRGFFYCKKKKCTEKYIKAYDEGAFDK